MIIIDGVQYGLDSILNSQQSDVVMQKIKDAFDYLDRKFWKKHLPVRFRHNAITYSDKRARAQESYELSAIDVNERTQKVVRYCQSIVPKQNAAPEYRPVSLIWRTRDMIFDEKSNKELCIFIWLYICKENTSVNVKILDEEKEADESFAIHAKSAAMHFFLYDEEMSPLLQSDEKLNAICNAWGVTSTARLTMKQKVEKLRTAIEFAEAKRDKTRDFDAFKQAMKSFSPLLEARALLNRAIDYKKIKYNKERDYYYYVNEEGKETAVLMKVPPTEILRKEDYTANKLSGNDDKLQELREAVGEEGEKTTRRPPVELPATVTKEYLDELLNSTKGMPIMKKMLTDLGISYFGKKKQVIYQELVNYYTAQKV